MESSSAVETFYVVASTDMQKANILIDRIREQVGGLPKLKASGTLRVTAEMIPARPADDPRTLEQQIFAVADFVTSFIQKGLRSPKNPTQKENNHAH